MMIDNNLKITLGQFYKRNWFHAVNAIIKSFLKTGKTMKAQMRGDKKSELFSEVKVISAARWYRLHKNFKRT